MGQLSLATHVASGNQEVSVLEAAGALDFNTVGEFEDALNGLFRSKHYKIILDLGRLDYISSSGIGILVGNIKEVRKNRGDIKFSNVSPEVFRVFDILELPKIFNFHKNEQEAALAF